MPGKEYQDVFPISHLPYQPIKSHFLHSLPFLWLLRRLVKLRLLCELIIEIIACIVGIEECLIRLLSQNLGYLENNKKENRCIRLVHFKEILCENIEFWIHENS